MTPEEYRDAVEARMPAAGYTVQQTGAFGLIGYRKDFKLRWAASTLHLLVHVATVPHVTADALEQYTRGALEHAKATRGQMRGLQSGVAVITSLVGASADEAAHAYATSQVVKGYAAFAWPTVVDLETGVRSSHAGRPILGAFFTGWMRAQVDALLPQPDAP